MSHEAPRIAPRIACSPLVVAHGYQDLVLINITAVCAPPDAATRERDATAAWNRPGTVSLFPDATHSESKAKEKKSVYMHMYRTNLMDKASSLRMSAA